MPLTIKQLESLWNKDKISYKNQEVGSGVQRFVKEVLQCEELFNLKEGRLSRPINKRKNEFIHEKKAKERRRVDYVIYVTPEVKIPVEVEQYTNIDAGKKQLLQYQADLDRKYGILTDGYTWQFYNNNVYREFTLKQIFYETHLFLEFWKEYVKTEYYYLSFFEGTKGQQFLFRDMEKLGVEDNRQMFFEDITKLIGSFREKLKLEHYFNGLTALEKEQKATEISYAYIIQFILYKTLVDNAFKDFGDEYEGYLRKTYKYLKAGQYKNILSIVDNISSKISENIYRPFMKEQEYIYHRFEQLYRKVENQLSDISPWLDIFVFIKKYNFENVQNEIFGYIYENYLKELFAEEKKGQYFTDPAVVNFMIQQIGYTHDKIKEKIQNNQLGKLSLLDTACGSGTFLYSATNEIIKSIGLGTEETSKQIEDIVTNNIFGLDIAEFPLYLTEMSVLMRMLPMIVTEKYNNPIDKKIKVFLTKDTVAEFIDTAIDNTAVDEQIRKGQLEFAETKLLRVLSPEFQSFMREPEDIKEMKESLKGNRIPRRRFDYVISNPPYIRYNDCIRQNVLIFELMKKRKVKLSNIYGVNLHSIPGNPKRYAPKPNIYAFFIAVGLALLKDNGKLCYIIPQTILVNPDFDVLRYHLSKFTTIEKIVIFSGKMFVGRGLKQTRPVPTSSLIFVVNKKIPRSNHQIEIINYEDTKDSIEETLKNILANKKVDKKYVLQSDLLKNVTNWNFIKQSKVFCDFHKEYKRNTNDMSIYYQHKVAKDKFGAKFYFDGGGIINQRFVSSESKGGYEIIERINPNRHCLLVPKSNKFYPRGKEISFPQGSQGVVSFSQRNKIIWRTKNTTNFQFTERDVILVTNKYLAISSNNRNEILYLVSLLNSRIMDIILGNIVKVTSEDTNVVLVSLRVIKEQIRVPKIIKENEHIKHEIIKRTEEMLTVEEKTLSDFVDFSNVLMQKFNKIKVDGRNLVLTHGGKQIKLKIKGNVGLINDTLSREFNSEELPIGKKKIDLARLRSLPVIDFEKKKELKDYIDLLVFALYFNIPLKKVKFSRVEEIKRLCSRNKYFTMIAKYQR